MSVKNYYTETVRHRKSELWKSDIVGGKKEKLTKGEKAVEFFLKHLDTCLRKTVSISRDPQIDSILSDAQNLIQQNYGYNSDLLESEKDIFEFAMTTASLIHEHGELQQKEKEGRDDDKKS